MKKTKAIWTAVLMMGLVISGANVAFSDTSATGAETKSEAAKPDANQNDLGAGSDCAPAQGSSSMENRDQAVGNDSPLTKNSQSKQDEASATAPCPPGQSAQPNDSINQGSTDKGGAGSSEAPNTNAGPDNHVK